MSKWSHGVKCHSVTFSPSHVVTFYPNHIMTLNGRLSNHLKIKYFNLIMILNIWLMCLAPMDVWSFLSSIWLVNKLFWPILGQNSSLCDKSTKFGTNVRYHALFQKSFVSTLKKQNGHHFSRWPPQKIRKFLFFENCALLAL